MFLTRRFYIVIIAIIGVIAAGYWLPPLFVVGNSEHAKPEQLEIFKDIMECAIDEPMRIPLDIKMFLDKSNNQNK